MSTKWKDTSPWVAKALSGKAKAKALGGKTKAKKFDKILPVA